MKKILLLTGAILLPLAAISATELARINTRVITLEEFDRKYKENLKFFQFNAPPRKAVLDDLIKRELGIQEARKLGLDKDPDVVEQMNTVLYHALINKKLNKQFEAIHIEDSEAKEFYSRNPNIRTSHIFLSVPGGKGPGSEEDKKVLARIKEILTEVRAGKASFAELAQRHSEGPSAPMGGDMDYQTKDKLPQAYWDAARKLKVGGVSDVVRSQFGYHIIKVTAIRLWDEADKAQVKRQVFEERRTQIFDKFMGQLRSQSKVSVNSELLKD
jgi:parvulin-like peptidyl-prolyl isomerase